MRKMLESYVTGIAKPILLFCSLPNAFVLQAGNKTINRNGYRKQLQLVFDSADTDFCHSQKVLHSVILIHVTRRRKGEKRGNILLPSILVLLQQCFKTFYKIILIKTL